MPRASDGRAGKPSPNLLAGKALPDRPDRVWAGDITFISAAAGWLYLAVVIDLCTRRIVGWSLATHMHADLHLPAVAEHRFRAEPVAAVASVGLRPVLRWCVSSAPSTRSIIALVICASRPCSPRIASGECPVCAINTSSASSSARASFVLLLLMLSLCL